MTEKVVPTLHVALFQPEIAPNTGTIGRTCVALGAKLWLIRPLGFRLDEKTLRRAGLDYWQHLDWEAVDDWDALVERTPDARRWLLTKTANRVYSDVLYQPGDMLVFGSETNGLPGSLIEAAGEAALRIPMRDEARCLNLASSMAIVAYEAARQLSARGDIHLL